MERFFYACLLTFRPFVMLYYQFLMNKYLPEDPGTCYMEYDILPWHQTCQYTRAL